jgi:hypothetical protein
MDFIININKNILKILLKFELGNIKSRSKAPLII